jgi:hypothetical protein
MMLRLRPKAFVAFLRSPAQWTMVLCTAAVVLFLQLFGTWTFKPDLYGQMYFFMKVFIWLCLAIGLGLLAHFGFDRLTDWLARAEEPRSGEKPAPPAAIFRRQ